MGLPLTGTDGQQAVRQPQPGMTPTQDLPAPRAHTDVQCETPSPADEARQVAGGDPQGPRTARDKALLSELQDMAEADASWPPPASVTPDLDEQLAARALGAEAEDRQPARGLHAARCPSP